MIIQRDSLKLGLILKIKEKKIFFQKFCTKKKITRSYIDKLEIIRYKNVIFYKKWIKNKKVYKYKVIFNSHSFKLRRRKNKLIAVINRPNQHFSNLSVQVLKNLKKLKI